MKLAKSWLLGCGGLAVTVFTRGLMSTLDCRVAYYDETVDPTHAAFRGPAVYLFWHEYIPLPFYLRGHCDIAMLLSQHQDAELLSQAARHMGFHVVRGSTNRGGVQALRELLRKSRHDMNLAITPDGPKGPRRKLAPGPIFLSSRLQIPLVAIGMGFDRPSRMPTWDRFALPRPFSRARVVVSPRVQIPARIGRDGLERYRGRIERLLTGLTVLAEDWAASGSHLVNQRPLERRAALGVRRKRMSPSVPALPTAPSVPFASSVPFVRTVPSVPSVPVRQLPRAA